MYVVSMNEEEEFRIVIGVQPVEELGLNRFQTTAKVVEGIKPLIEAELRLYESAIAEGGGPVSRAPLTAPRE